MPTKPETSNAKPCPEPTSELHNDDGQDFTALLVYGKEVQEFGTVADDPELQDVHEPGNTVEVHSSIVEPPSKGSPVSSDRPNEVESYEMPSNYMERDSAETLRPIVISVLLQAPAQCLTLGALRVAIEGDYAEYRHGRTTWFKTVEDLLHQYDFPTVPVLRSSRVSFKLLPGTNPQSGLFDPSKFHTKPFRLMGLPHRVRLMVYRYVLSLPTADGWIVDEQYTANASHYYDNKPPGDSLQLRTRAAGHFTLVSPPIQTWMALISVNSKLYKEAMPIFYAHNTLRFSSCTTLHQFLTQVPTRRPFVQRIALHYDPPALNSSCTAAFTLLSETSLKHLRLELDEGAALVRGNGYGGVARLPGFYALERLRGLESLSFAGRFDRAKRFLAKMLRPRLPGERRVDDVEARLERKWVATRRELRLSLADLVRKQRKEARMAAAAARREEKERKKRVEQAQRREERAQEREKREEEKARAIKLKRKEREEEQIRKEAERAVERREKMLEREEKQAARERQRATEKASQEVIRANKRDALLAKQRLMDGVRRLNATGKRPRDDEADGKDMCSSKRRKTVDERNIDPRLLDESVDDAGGREDSQGHPVLTDTSEEE